LIQATAHKFDHIFIDKDAHFSLWDALLSCNKEITPFHHLSVDDLCQKLKTELHATERPLVLSDGLFPVSGEIAPLADYLNLVKPLGGQVYLDDAHAVGVLGSDGLGTANYYGISDEACQTSGTLAKALGGFGGILWGESKWINYLDRNSRFLTGSSPLPVPVVAASAKALELARLHPELRLSLEKNVTFLRKGLISLGFTLQQSPSPIICIKSERDLNLDNLQSALFKRGIATTLVRSYPSTPPGGALRIAVFSNHSMEQLQRLINNIKELV
ncbi:MAG: pyridoxal phosphate-dependent aminotransferase family protein, partial [Anaerolineae bacterium]|nr:pyridoxal phosphate-dependent aminotransferase family protein [Anaerolineae bacterium]